MVFAFFPETRRRTLEDMDTVFVNSNSYLDVVRVARSMPQASILELESGGGEKNTNSNGPSEEAQREVVTHLEAV